MTSRSNRADGDEGVNAMTWARASIDIVTILTTGVIPGHRPNGGGWRLHRWQGVATAARAPVHQRRRPQRHPAGPWRPALTTPEEPRECLLPRPCPIATRPQGERVAKYSEPWPPSIAHPSGFLDVVFRDEYFEPST